MKPPSLGKPCGYTPATWLALVALFPMSIYLGIEVRAAFFLPGILSLVFLVLGVVKRRRGDGD